MERREIESIILEQRAEALLMPEPLIARNISLAVEITKNEITVITGVRRCGKSTLLKSLLRDPSTGGRCLFVDFDDPRLLDFRHQDFAKVYDIVLDSRQNGNPGLDIVLFDELQNIDGWEKWVTLFADQKRIKVFITGSNSKLLSSELSTHITGRHSDINLFPLSFAEIFNFLEKGGPNSVQLQNGVTTSEQRATLRQAFAHYLEYGGFPRVWESRDTNLLVEYFSDIIYKDIVRRKRISNPERLRRLGLVLMTDASRLINKTKLARDIGLTDPQTISKYISYFVESFIGYELRICSSSVRKQLRNQTKFYPIDAAFCKRNGLQSRSRDGAYLENAVFIELKRRNLQVTYATNSDSSEIDFVAEDSTGRRLIIQVAWSLENKTTEDREIKAFRAFCSDSPPLTGDCFLIISGDEQRVIDTDFGKVQVIPFYLWALQKWNSW